MSMPLSSKRLLSTQTVYFRRYAANLRGTRRLTGMVKVSSCRRWWEDCLSSDEKRRRLLDFFLRPPGPGLELPRSLTPLHLLDRLKWDSHKLSICVLPLSVCELRSLQRNETESFSNFGIPGFGWLENERKKLFPKSFPPSREAVRTPEILANIHPGTQLAEHSDRSVRPWKHSILSPASIGLELRTL